MNANHPILALSATLVGLFAAPAIAATVVYQDNFDNDGLATNTGVGGGLTVAFARRGGWVENGVLEATGTVGSTNGSVHSTSGFDLANGFTLTVTYNTATVAAGEVNRVNIGLIDAAAFGVTSSDAGSTRNPFSDNNDKYGIGLNLTPDLGDQGLNFADDAGAGSVTFLSNDQTIAAGTQTLVLTMDDSSNYSYSIDGATATTGSVPGGFDYSRDFNFFASYQSFPHEAEIREVTLSVIPEPSSLTLVGLGVLGMFSRRRR